MVLKILEFEKMKTLRNFILEGEFYVLNVHIYAYMLNKIMYGKKR